MFIDFQFLSLSNLLKSWKSLTGKPQRRKHSRSAWAGKNAFGAESLERRELLTTFTVTTAVDDTIDNDVISLREAITLSNNSGGPDEIVFSSALSGQRILLSQGQLEIFEPVTITGLGATNTVIDAQQIFRVFALGETAGNVTFDSLTVTGGRTAIVGAAGGGIYSESTGILTLIDCAVTANETNATFSDGGGIFSLNSAIVLLNSTVSGNTTFGQSSPGGGVATDRGAITLINSTISGNVTRGGNSGGGGIATYDGNIRLTNSTVTLNATVDGSSPGGALISVGNGSRQSNIITINNSIVADNTSINTTAEDLSKNIGTSALNVNNSIIGVNTGSGLTSTPPGSPGANGNLIGTNSNPVDPMLGSLAANGAATRTHAPLAGSPAIDGGSNALAVDFNNVALQFDQAGNARIFNTTVDIGSFEGQSVSSGPTVSFSVASTSTNEGAGTITLTVNLSTTSTQAVTIPFTLSGTASNSVDYTIASSPLTIPANTTSATIQISLINDTTSEGNETIVVSLGTPTNATLGTPATQTVTIIDNDSSSGSPTNIILSSNTVQENLANAVVGNLTATDPNQGDTHTFTIVAGGQGNQFVIENNQLKVGAAGLDYESLSGGTASLTIRATDNTGLSFDKTFTLNVTDVNEVPSAAAGQVFSVAQNASVATIVGTVQASDPDTTAPNDTLTYSIQGGNTGSAFAINSSTGQLTVSNSSPLNPAQNPQFTLIIRVADGGNPSLGVTQTVVVNVAAENQAPTIPAGQTFSINENVSNGAVVGTVSASDPDTTAPNNTLTYSITGGNTNNAFAINSTTGQITVINAGVLDSSTTPTYSLQVRATDGGSPALSATQTVTIQVTAANQAPTIPAGQSFTVVENPAANTVIGTITASDPDTSAPNNTLTYSIVSGNTNNAFTINPATGQLRVSNPGAVNFENNPTFTLQVRATDGGSPALSATQSVTVTVTNVNEAPVITANQIFSVAENAPNNTVLGNVVAIDPDSTAPDNTLTYSIVSGNTNNAFAINPSTGQVTVNNSSALDSANGTSYTLSIRATDGGNPALSSTQNIRINLLEVNESPTIPAGQSFTITENPSANAIVGTVVATDPNSSAPSNTLSYTITGGNSSGAFSINSTTGQIRVANPGAVDFETNQQFTLQIQVIDGGSPPLSASQSVSITVTNVNEVPQIPSGQSFNVGEQASNGTVVGTVNATDPDATAPNNTLTYTIVSGNTSGAFAINPATGQITVANSLAVDSSTNPTFSLLVRATDAGNPALSSTQTVTISVNDANEAPTIPAGQVFTVPENSVANTLVGRVIANDPDISAPNNTLTYSILGGNTNNAFAINPSTGQIFVNNPAALDSEAGTSFTLQIQVVDGGNPAFSATGTVTIQVTDANEAPTIPANQSFNLLENSPTNTVVGQVVATDPDGIGPNGTLNYSITGGNTNGAFQINPTTGQLTVNQSSALNFEAQSQFSLQVTVTDSGTPALATSQTVTVILGDVNEAPTLQLGQSFTAIEGSAVNTIVGTVIASDPDTTAPNNTMEYAIVGGNTGNAFTINQATGQITVSNPAALNSSLNPTFALQVRAADGGNLFDIETVTIQVNELNLPPVLTNPGSTPTYVHRSRQPVVVVPDITVSDPNGETDIAQILIRFNTHTGRRNRDQISLSSIPGTLNDSTSGGQRQITITLDQGITNSEVQSVLRSLRFSTAGRGLRLRTREFQIQVVDREGASSNLITQSVNVTRRQANR